MTTYTDTEMDELLAELFEFDEPESLPAVNKVIAMPIDMIVDSGKGAQMRIRNAGYEYLFQTEPKGAQNKFYGFRNEVDRSHTATMMSSIEIIERVSGISAARAYIDIDAPADASDSELAAISEAFVIVAEEYCKEGFNLKPIVNWCDRPEKRSIHLISDGWSLPNGEHVMQFAKDVKDLFKGMKQFDWIDRSGGSSSYGLRISGCPKNGNFAATLAGPVTWLQCSSNIVVPQVAKLDTVRQVVIPAMPDTAEAKEFMLDITKRFADIYHFDGLIANRRKPSYCQACERKHDKAGAYISITADGSMFFRCRRTPKEGPTLANLVMPSSLPKEPPPTDKYDIITKPELVGGEGIYNSKAIRDNGKGDMYIQSAWGTGKSYHICEIIKKAVKKDKNTKVLIISSRKTLSAQISNDVGAKSYDQIRGPLDVDKDRVTVWQIDSLDRIPTKTVFDIIYIDELSQLTAHVWSSGSINYRARGGLTQLRLLVADAGRIIITDNDLTDSQITAFKDIRIGKKSRTYSNLYKPWANTTISLFKSKLSIEKVMASMMTFIEENAALRAQGLPWSSCVVPCHSLKLARAIDIDLRSKGHTTLIYTSETDDHIKRAAFQNASIAWGGINRPSAVIYTSAVSVGVSCNLVEFSNCYAFFRARNCASTQSAQMLFRCRALKNVMISYDSSGSNARAPQTPKELFKWVTLARNVAALPDEFRDDRSPFVRRASSSDPKELELLLSDSFEGRLWVSQSIDANRSSAWFCERLISILNKAGMAVSYEVVEKKVNTNIMASIEQSSTVAENKRSECMANALPEAAEKGLENQKDDEPMDMTQAQKDGERAKWICINMGKSPSEIAELGTEQASIWLKAYEPMTTQFKRCTALLDNTRCAPHEDEAVKSDQEAFGLCTLAFDALGIDPLDKDAKLSPDLTSSAIKDIVTRINKHCGRVYNDPNGARRSKVIGDYSKIGGRQKQSIISTLNVALSFIGAKISAYYASTRDKDRGHITRYDLTWLWLECDIEPRIEHPVRLMSKADEKHVWSPDDIADALFDLSC